MYSVVLSLGVSILGCAKPIGVRQAGFARVYDQLNTNILDDGRLSPATVMVLQRFNWHKTYKETPLDVLQSLHEETCKTRYRELLFALAELSYATGQELDRQDAYLAAAIYAYLYLLGDDFASPPNPFDRRFRVASDLYNSGLAKALLDHEDSTIILQNRGWTLPMGRIDITTSRPGFPWGEDEFNRFIPADAFSVYGFIGRRRDPGLGVPLIAMRTPSVRHKTTASHLPPNLQVPATAFLRLQGGICQMATDGLKGSLELYTAFNVPEIEVGTRTVPLETDVTAPLAHLLQHSAVWNFELGSFLRAEKWSDQAGLWMLQPYQPGKIPVVFVHGTASSPARWAEMFNELHGDPDLRQRYQFWYFAYTTGNPIIYSAKLLRDALDNVLATLDPEGNDEALRRMIVMGHSQGGLLTRMQVIHSGDRLWQPVSHTPLDELDLTHEQRDFLRGAFFFDPSTYIHRVIFIATPHRGSFVAGNWLGRLSSRLIRQPKRLLRLTTGLFEKKNVPLKIGKKFPPASTIWRHHTRLSAP